MNDLAELQRSFQRAVLDGDDAVLARIADSTRVPARTRVGIYADAYRVRLRQALASTYPRSKQFLGEDAFDAATNAYIDAHRSQYKSIRWYGEAFAQTLARIWPQRPWCAELAEWEWTIALAFDAADASPIDTAALAAVDNADWPQLRFGFHPSMHRICMRTNAPAIFKALTEERAPPTPQQLEQPSPWLIWRRELMTQYRSMAVDECDALHALAAGETFAGMCTALAQQHTEEHAPLRAATLLRTWIDEGLVIGFEART